MENEKKLERNLKELDERMNELKNIVIALDANHMRRDDVDVVDLEFLLHLVIENVTKAVWLYDKLKYKLSKK